MRMAQKNVNMLESQNLSKDWMCIADIGGEDFRGAGSTRRDFFKARGLRS